MKKIFVFGLTSLALTLVCGAQSTGQTSTVSKGAVARSAPDDSMNFIKGSGTTGAIPLFVAPGVLGDSVMNQSAAGAIGIGGSPSGNAKLGVSGPVSASQYKIGPEPVVSVPGANSLAVGIGAGKVNAGSDNAFFGGNAGQANTTGHSNAYFGASAGASSSTASANAFFGALAGLNSDGNANAFFGVGAGRGNQGDNNTYLGANAKGTPGIENATAVGSDAFVTQSNSLVLGSVHGVNGATDNTRVGIGTTAPKSQLHVEGGRIYISMPGEGILLKAPNGLCRHLTLSSAGQLELGQAICP